jgi:hypothetical protein
LQILILNYSDPGQTVSVGRLVFVLKETEPERWLNSGGGDYVAQLKPPELGSLVDKVIEAEASSSHWSLFNRFLMANEILDAADAAGGLLCLRSDCSLVHGERDGRVESVSSALTESNPPIISEYLIPTGPLMIMCDCKGCTPTIIF